SARRGLGEAVLDWTGQHSPGAYRRGANPKERTDGSGRDLCAHGEAVAKSGGAFMSQGLAIVGYGKMGRLIEQLAPEYGFEVRAKFDSRNNCCGQGLTRQALQGVDVAVEFSTPASAPSNIARLAAAGVCAAVGTTGWLEQLPAARVAVSENGTGL